MDEYAEYQLKESGGTKLKPTMKEGFDSGDHDEKKTLEELDIEPKPLRKLMKETLGDNFDEVNVSHRVLDLLYVHTNSEQQRDSSQAVASNNCKQHNKRKRNKETKGEGERCQEGRKRQEQKKVEEGADEQVEEDVMGWTEVKRMRRTNTVQIFVKVNGSKANLMEVSLTDDKVEDVVRQILSSEDVYVTMQGKVLNTSEKLKSCGVTDGWTIQVASRFRSGGKHKDNKGQREKKQAAKEKGPEQKTEGRTEETKVQ